MATKGLIAIHVEDGMIQSVFASPDIAPLLKVEIYDLDTLDDTRDEKCAELDEAIKDGGLVEIA